MSAAVCFRCDWEGETRKDVCPRCGTPLYRAQEARRPRTRRRAGRGNRARTETERLRPTPAAADPQPPADRLPKRPAGPWRTLAGMAAAAVVLAFVWTRLPRTTGAPAPRASIRPSVSRAPGGALVYAAGVPGKPNRQILWNLDPADGVALPGPRIPRAVEIVDASLAGRGWVGITAEGSRGRLTAYVLKGTSLADTPVRLGSGDLVAWGPRGHQVAIAHQGPARDGCRRVSIDLVQVEDGYSERVFTNPHLCGELLSLGRDGELTYFTWAEDGRVSIAYDVVFGRAHPILRGYVMVSVSPASDLLVKRPTSGTLMYWRGTGPPSPYRSNGTRLVAARVLAWSDDAFRAAVVGRFGFSSGLFLVDAGPSDTRRVPRFVVGGASGMGAAFGPDGTLYVAVGGHLFEYSTGRLANVLLPAGVLPPAGPMAWLP